MKKKKKKQDKYLVNIIQEYIQGIDVRLILNPEKGDGLPFP